ncbi:MAG: hypothetical protein HYU66_16610 [Armatimonadetes bacterium]|nr:hypothetical protein [Armatimonadota bacterium]
MSCTAISFGPRFHPRSAPVTFWFLVATLVVWLLGFFGGAAAEPALRLMVFSPLTVASMPWTLLTHAIVNLADPIGLFFLSYVFWWVGCDLERWWGSRVHAGFLAAMSLGCNGMVTLGHLLNPAAPVGIQALGLGALLCGLFTVWALRNPSARVLLLILPVSAWVIAGLEIAFTWYVYGPFLGLFAVLGTAGLAALYFYKGQRFHAFLRRFGRRPPPPSKGRPTREDRQRDKRFQEIMRNSGLHLVEDDE